MSIMGNKVTRRIALGSIAGGLAGATLVLRALKGKYSAEVPPCNHDERLKAYASEWERYVKMVDVEVEKANAASSIMLDRKSQHSEKFRVVNISAEYTGDAKYPQPPNFYNVLLGRVTGIAPVVDDKPTLLVETESSIARYMPTDGLSIGDTDTSLSKCIVVFADGDLDYFEASAGHKTIVAPSYKMAGLSSALCFGYPQNKPLARGTSWTYHDKYKYNVLLPCRVIDFSRVERRDAVEIVAKLERTPKLVVAGWGMGKHELEKMQEEASKKAKDSNQVIHVTAYIDVKTGLPLRQVWTAGTHTRNESHEGRTVVIINQLLGA